MGPAYSSRTIQKRGLGSVFLIAIMIATFVYSTLLEGAFIVGLMHGAENGLRCLLDMFMKPSVQYLNLYLLTITNIYLLLLISKNVIDRSSIIYRIYEAVLSALLVLAVIFYLLIPLIG